jgi:hypothetical protein
MEFSLLTTKPELQHYRPSNV